MNQKISVLMPLYNAALYVESAIQSVVNQTYTDWELIIVDDGSTDDSLAVVKRYESDKIRVYTQPNSGACMARNKALSLVKGAYVKFLDADDLLAPDCLEKQFAQIQTLAANQIPFGDYNYINQAGQITSTYLFEWQLPLVEDSVYFFFTHWEVLITAPLHRIESLLAINGFDEQLKRGQETDLHFRLALSGVEFVYCPLHTFSYRSYVSIDRLSAQKEQLLEQYSSYIYEKNERLLREKFVTLAPKYQLVFRTHYFVQARKCFARRQLTEGKINLSKALCYKPRSLFMWFYYVVGQIIGYVRLESAFQYRLSKLKTKKLNS